MTREWKVGDAVRYAGGISVVVDESCRSPIHVGGPHWHHTGGGGGWDRLEDRPSFGERYVVVVIDPEDEAQLRRIGDLLVEHDSDLRAALRSLINPKPAEPTGLGAVVEDTTGAVWIRAARIAHGWHRPMNVWRAYADISAVKILSEGVRA